MKNVAGKISACLGVLTLFASLVFAGDVKFTLSSSAIKGKPEIGFDSKLKSAGRIDGLYAAKDNGPANSVSFPLEWKGLPDGTRSLALVFDDLDAKAVMAVYGMKGDSFVHWTAANIDPACNGLKANASMENPGFVQGKNSAGSTNYTGPQPPSNVPKDAKKPLIHIYRLKVYALSAPVELKNGFSLEELKEAIKGKILGEADIYMSYNN